MKYVLGATAVLAAIGAGVYFYMQNEDGKAAEDQANQAGGESTAEPEASA